VNVHECEYVCVFQDVKLKTGNGEELVDFGEIMKYCAWNGCDDLFSSVDFVRIVDMVVSFIRL